jgi:hypothetical protein
MQHETKTAKLVHEIMIYAENELTALHSAVDRIFGPEQAELATQDWLRELEVMDWPAGAEIPNWRQPTFAAVRRLEERTGSFFAAIAGAPESAVQV